MKTIATIGYESDTQGAVIGKLKDADVKVLIDVRAIASSRRAGFSKSLLAASLAEAGIEYVHLRDLGTPKAGRDAAHAGRVEEMLHMYREHLEEPAAQIQLARAAEIAGDRKAALLCYEADARGCHRQVIAQRLSEELGLKVENL
jgi:uncharacterized protein (DUF488 family)